VSESPPTPDAPAVVEAAEAAPAPAPVSDASIEAAYLAVLNADIHARTLPPDTPAYRLLSPTGSVRVRFVLDRTGSPTEVAVDRTSGSHILDTQGVHIVASGHYHPFPDGLYPGQKRHPFVITVNFL
jgi:TonB family protein